MTVGAPLFPRIDAQKELAELEALHVAAQAPAADPLPEPLPPVSFDDFCKVEMTVVKVLTCEKVKKSEKLLKFTLDDGTGHAAQTSPASPSITARGAAQGRRSSP